MSKFFRASNVVLLLLCAMYFITYLDRVNVSTAAAGFSKEFDLSKTQIGLVFSAFAYPYLVFQIIGGWVSDRFGSRRTLIVCGLIWSAATVLTGLAGGLASMLVARVLLGLGEGATFPAATSAMSRWVAPRAARLRPGRHARGCARRQRGGADGDRRDHGVVRLARSVLCLRRDQLRLGAALGGDVHGEPGAASAHHRRGARHAGAAALVGREGALGAACSPAWRR